MEKQHSASGMHRTPTLTEDREEWSSVQSWVDVRKKIGIAALGTPWKKLVNLRHSNPATVKATTPHGQRPEAANSGKVMLHRAFEA